VVRAEAAQIGGCDTARRRQAGGTVTEVLAQVVVQHLGQLIQDVAEVGFSRRLDVSRAQHLHQAGADGVRCGNARAGNHHLLQLDGPTVIGRRQALLRKCRHGGGECQNAGDAGQVRLKSASHLDSLP
jgi:hypothetical protein